MSEAVCQQFTNALVLPNLSEEAAALRLQKAWRLVFRPRTTARLVRRMERVGLTTERVQQMR